MEETILTWNITNWITVLIMVAAGFLLLALVAQVFHKVTGGKFSANGGDGKTTGPGLAAAS